MAAPADEPLNYSLTQGLALLAHPDGGYYLQVSLPMCCRGPLEEWVLGKLGLGDGSVAPAAAATSITQVAALLKSDASSNGSMRLDSDSISKVTLAKLCFVRCFAFEQVSVCVYVCCAVCCAYTLRPLFGAFV
jgi:hypothetical protein